jgi:hypothetical protein
LVLGQLHALPLHGVLPLFRFSLSLFSPKNKKDKRKTKLKNRNQKDRNQKKMNSADKGRLIAVLGFALLLHSAYSATQCTLPMAAA